MYINTYNTETQMRKIQFKYTRAHSRLLPIDGFSSDAIAPIGIYSCIIIYGDDRICGAVYDGIFRVKFKHTACIASRWAAPSIIILNTSDSLAVYQEIWKTCGYFFLLHWARVLAYKYISYWQDWNLLQNLMWSINWKWMHMCV